ncbi:MAG: hypothetical protein JO290_03985 [Sphingomonadaceae bacterium]|nr:hypothetical protein [Sphingomonadaceae bacterium]
MKRLRWPRPLLAILGVALLSAVGAAALPDNPYQRWQLIENTLYGNATWAYERIHFDPAPIDVAIIGSSRTLLGLSGPCIAEKLAADGLPLNVANLSVIEDGRNIQWAIARELFRFKKPRVLVMVMGSSFHPWGHPGFKYIAPAAGIAAPPAPLLHNWPLDLIYLPYRQIELAGAALLPHAFGLRPAFDPAIYRAKPIDFTVSQTLADGKRYDMDAPRTAEYLRDEAAAFAGQHHPSHLPAAIRRVTERDEPAYSDAVIHMARAAGVPVLFAYLPEFEGPRVSQTAAFYGQRGRIIDFSDLAQQAGLYQSFAHLNHKGAMIASDRVARAVEATLRPAAAATAGPAAGAS